MKISIEISEFRPQFVKALDRCVNAENSVHDLAKRIFVAAGILDASESPAGVSVPVDGKAGEVNARIEAVQAELTAWAVEGGHSESWVRSVVSRLLREHHIQRRQSGAGRKANPAAVALVDSIDIEEFGGDWEAVANALLAASRLAKRRAADAKKSAK